MREGRADINALFLLSRKKENPVHRERELLSSREVASNFFFSCTCPSLACTPDICIFIDLSIIYRYYCTDVHIVKQKLG